MLKRIKTEAEIEREKKRNQTIIGSVLIGILLLSSFTFFGGSDDSSSGKVKENGIEFSRINEFWNTKINGIEFNFQNLPSQVADVPVVTSFGLSDYSGATVYFVNSAGVASEILTNLNPYVLRYQEACLEGETCERDLPVKNCSEKLIIYKESNSTKVYQEENCIYLEGDGVRAADAFLYKILGIN